MSYIHVPPTVGVDLYVPNELLDQSFLHTNVGLPSCQQVGYRDRFGGKIDPETFNEGFLQGIKPGQVGRGSVMMPGFIDPVKIHNEAPPAFTIQSAWFVAVALDFNQNALFSFSRP